MSPSGHQIEGSLFDLASLSCYSTVALGVLGVLFQTWAHFLPALCPHGLCAHEDINVKGGRWKEPFVGVCLSFRALSSRCGVPLPRITINKLEGAGMECGLRETLRCSGKVFLPSLCVFHAKAMEKVNDLWQIFPNQGFFLLGVRLME